MHVVAFSPRRPELLATCGGDGEVCLWDVKRREKQGQVVGGAPGAPGAPGARCAARAIAFAPDGSRLAYSHSDDWSKGEAGYEALCATGFANEVRVVSLD